MVRDPDQKVEMNFLVTIRATGHPYKVRRTVGKTLAKLVDLNFPPGWEVHVGTKKGNTINWSIMDHDGGIGTTGEA